MPTAPSRTAKLKQLNKNQVHAMALENLKRHLELKGSGEQSAPDKVLDVLLAAATNNTSIEQECSAMVGAPSPNTVRGVLRESLISMSSPLPTLCVSWLKLAWLYRPLLIYQRLHQDVKNLW